MIWKERTSRSRPPPRKRQSEGGSQLSRRCVHTVATFLLLFVRSSTALYVPRLLRVSFSTSARAPKRRRKVAASLDGVSLFGDLLKPNYLVKVISKMCAERLPFFRKRRSQTKLLSSKINFFAYLMLNFSFFSQGNSAWHILRRRGCAKA